MANELEPSRQNHGRLQDCKSLQAALSHPEMVSRMKAACPKVLDAERMLRVAALAVAKTKNLDQVPMMEVLGAFLMLGSLGLEPNTVLGHAYLIPFKKRIRVPGAGPGGKDLWKDGYTLQTIIGYTGYIALAYRSGLVKGMHADVVYEGDDFSFSYGSDAHLRHKPTGSRNRTPLWAYCHASLADGGQAFTVLPWAHVLDIRNGSQGYQAALAARNRQGSKGDLEPAYAGSPWVAHIHPMAAKTAVRAMRPYLPMSIELARASEIEDASSHGASYAGVFDTTSENIDAMSPEPSEDQPTETQQVTKEEPGPSVVDTKPKPEAERVDKRETPKEEPKVKTVDLPKKEAPTQLELVSLDGEVVWDGIDPVVFAENFMTLFDQSPNDFAKLRNLNQFNYEAACKDAKARMILGVEDAPETTGGVAIDEGDYLIELGKLRSGVTDHDGYMTALEELVSGCDAQQLELVVKVNQPVYETFDGMKKLRAMKIVSDRKRVLK